MSQSNFDIKTFSAENIRIKQERQHEEDSQAIYESLARQINEFAKKNPCVTGFTKTCSVSSEHMKNVCSKFTSKGFAASYRLISANTETYQITISWDKN
jgi:hypothetical protein